MDSLRTAVQKLTQEVEQLRAGHDTIHLQNAALSDRVEALEKRFTALETRMTHMDHLLTSMQLDIRRLQKGVEELRLSQTVKLDALQATMDRIATKLGA